MSLKNEINQDYFEWLCHLVNIDSFSKDVTYTKLLSYLHTIQFTWIIPIDYNRADDGIKLRRRYSIFKDDMRLEKYISGPCSVLEMMVALSVRCEETIMDDVSLGNRTGKWFWGMIHNLGLTPMRDYQFDRNYVDEVIERMLNRTYERDGTGGLFRVENCRYDMRNVEIWTQLSWYLASIR